MKLRSMLAVALLTCIVLVGCSTTWVTTFDNILTAAAPALINVLNIIAIAEGQPINAPLEAKINGDAASLKTLAVDFSTASASAAPGVCSQLQSAISTYAQDQQQVLSLANVVDPAVQQKIAVLSALISGSVSAVMAVVPNCNSLAAAPQRANLKAAPPLPLKDFVRNYNAELAKRTGNGMVDKFTSSHKVHVHGGLMRVASLGQAY